MGRSDGAYTRAELENAARVLDLPTNLDISSAEINSQWKKLMGRVHPDAGGSNYFAEQLNTSRDILINWVKSGRKIDVDRLDQDSSRGTYTRQSAPQEDTTRPKKDRKFGSKIKKIIGWIFFLGLASRIITNIFGLNTDYSWHFDSKKESGNQIDAVFKNVSSLNNMQVALYCVSPLGSNAKVIALTLAERDKDTAIISVKYRQSDQYVSSEAKIFSEREAGIAASKVVGTMTQDEQISQFGVAGVVLVAKWLLNKNSDTEISNDVRDLFKNYYGLVLYRGTVHFNVETKKDNKISSYEGDVILDYPNDLVSQVFAACTMGNLNSLSSK